MAIHHGTEDELFCAVTVGEALFGFEPGLDVSLHPALGCLRDHCEALGVTGALLSSNDGLAVILEGSEPALAAFHDRADINPSLGTLQLLVHDPAVKRHFGGWPMAYVAPSRWLLSALGSRTIAEMKHPSTCDARFLITLVHDFVGYGP